MPFGNYLANKMVLDHLVNGTGIHLLLHTGNPSATGGAARANSVPSINVTGKFSLLGIDGVSNNADIISANFTVEQTISHISLWTSGTLTECLYYGPVASPRLVGVGNAFRAQTGALVIRNVT